MYLKISFYEYAEHEWDDECREYLLREVSVPLNPGVVAEAPAFEVVRIGARDIMLHMAEGLHASYGTFGTGMPGQEPPEPMCRPREQALQTGTEACVSSSWSYNGSTHGQRVVLKLMDGDVPPP